MLKWASDFVVRTLDVCEGFLQCEVPLNRRYATDADVQCLCTFLGLSIFVVNVRDEVDGATCLLLPEGGAREPQVGMG